VSVFTHVTAEQLAAWLEAGQAGRLLGFAGIEAGVQNTNYRVSSDRGQWVLTLFETLEATELAFYLGLMAHLAARGLPCPAPLADSAGRIQRPLANKPAVLFTCLLGREVVTPDAKHCAAVGDALARLHLAAADFPSPQANPRGLGWCRGTGAHLLPLLDPEAATLLTDELEDQSAPHVALPRGIVHADLFRDNVLFDGSRLSGLLDFYFAGEDELLFDLAVAANDWCLDDAGQLDAGRTRALLQAYHARRPLLTEEAKAWPRLLRRAALRFWLSRLQDQHQPREGQQVLIKDPTPFRRLLETHRQTAAPWLD
jgi:homoserine kinase type II